MKKLIPLFLLATLVVGAHGKTEVRKDWEAQLAKTLALSKDQQTKVSAVRAAHREALRALKLRIAEAKQAVAAAMRAPEKGEAHRKDLLARFAMLQDLKREQAMARFEKALAVRDVLNPDQLKKFQGLRGEHGPDAKEEDR